MLGPTVPLSVSRAEALKRAEELLETATLDRVKSSPAAEISGGQKKLLEFVRTMMTDPALILLDEPFNGINPALIEVLIAMVRKHNKDGKTRSEEHTSELQSLMRISYAVFCLKKKHHNIKHTMYSATVTT